MTRNIKIIIGILGIVLLDQITKGALLFLETGSVPLAGSNFEIMPHPEIFWRVTDFFNIFFTWNTGTAFSFLRNFGERNPWIIMVATGLIIVFLLNYLLRRAQSYERVPLVMIIGGALGNLVDRLRFNAVIDFLYFHIGGWSFPAFNIADCFITLGVVFYILNWYLARRRCINKIKG